MSAGISRAMIFSKSVLLISFYHQGTASTGVLSAQACAEIFDDLVAEALAAPPPPLGACQLHHADSKPAKHQHLGPQLQLAMHFLPQGTEEKQLTPFAGLKGKSQQIRFAYALRERTGDGQFGFDSEIGQGLLQGLGEFRQ